MCTLSNLAAMSTHILQDAFCNLAERIPHIYKGDPRTCTILIQAWGSNWEYPGFSSNQNNSDLSGVYVYCSLSVMINALWCEIVDAFVFACVCGRQNPNTPNLSPMADDAITLGIIPGTGSPSHPGRARDFA